jgi:membrane-bound lytic murein transglycosylase D
MQSMQAGQTGPIVHSGGNQRGAGKFAALLGLLVLVHTLGFPERIRRSEAGEPGQKAGQLTSSLQSISVSDTASARQLDYNTLLQQTLPQFDIDPKRVPDFFKNKVRQYLYDYTRLHRKQTQKMFRRGERYITLIKRIMRQHQLPMYFAYIPLAESAFYIDAAHPKSGARGLWQFMPNTARAYGLNVSAAVDERLDPFRSTRAAARYLRELQDMFGKGSPLLILSAYNYGENNLSRAIVRARTRDIWSLIRKRQIPYQTREYLVKMVTMWLIVSQTDRFQLTMDLEKTQPLTRFSEIMFPHPISLATLAQQIELTEQYVRAMNPHLLGARVPAHTSIRIPPPNVDAFMHLEVRLTPPLANERCCARLMVIDACSHTVEQGETPSAIARRYAINLATLRTLNELEGANPIIHPGQRLAVCKARVSPRTEADPKLW